MKIPGMCFLMVVLGCSDMQHDSFPEFPPQVKLENYTLDSLHQYGAGDCYGTIRRYSGPENLVIDSLTCSEYSYNFIWYWLDEQGRVYQTMESKWQSLIQPTMDDYYHIYSETISRPMEGQRIIRVDTLENHYLFDGNYPGPIDKMFIEASHVNMDSVMAQTWRRK